MLKDPNATLDYTVDWAAPKSRTNPNGPWLADGEVIATSTWTISPADGLTIATPAPSHTDTTATIWLSGGVVGQPRVRVTNRITTSHGRQDERTFPIDLTDR